MKKLFPYNKFVTEGVRNLMTPKSEEEILKSLEHLNLHQKLDIGVKNNLPWLVKNVIDDGVNVRTQENEALRHAAWHGYTEIVKMLIDAGADIHAKNEDPLYFASQNGHTEIVKILLDKGADVNIRDDSATLRVAIFKNHMDIVKLLLDAGADVNARGDWALLIAIINKRSRMVKMLLDRGANVNDQHMDYAKNEEGHIGIIKQLEKHKMKVNESVRDKMTPKSKEEIRAVFTQYSGKDPDIKLVKGAVEGLMWVVKEALEEGGNIHVQGDTALRHAAYNGHIEMVEFLLSLGADVKPYDYEAERWAVQKGHKEIVKLLSIARKKRALKDSGKLKESVRDKMTPKPEEDIKNGLYDYFGNNQVTNKDEYVKETGIFDIDNLYIIFDYEEYYDTINNYFYNLVKGQKSFQMKIGGDGYTCYPEQKIAFYRDDCMTDAWYFDGNLLGGIVDYMMKNKLNESIRDQMTSTSEEDIKDRIYHMNGGKLYGLLWHTILHEDEDAFKMYIDCGADINIKNSMSETLIMNFVRLNYYSIVKFLLEQGADPNIGNDNGDTPLWLATKNQTNSIVQLLLDSGKLIPKKHNQLEKSLKFARKIKTDVLDKLESYIKTLNESIRDKMTPKSNDEISNVLKGKSNEFIFQKWIQSDDPDAIIYYNILKKRRKSKHYIDFIKTFPWYINNIDKLNEGVRDQMTPKSEEELRYFLKNLTPDEKLSMGTNEDIPWLVKLAIAEDKNINFGYTLQNACRYGYTEIVKMLLDAGADVHLNGEIALLWAAENGHIDIVQLLLDHGAKVDTRKRWAIKLAEENKHGDVVKLLSKYLNKELGVTEGVGNTSVRDMMTPKSEEDINRDIQKQFLEHEWDEIGWENLVKYWFNGNDKLREWLEKQFVKPELDRFKDFIKREYHYKQEYYSNPEFSKIMKNSKLFSTRFSRFFSKNESIRDQMTPKSEEEIRKSLQDLNPNEKLKKSAFEGIIWAVKEALTEGADIHYMDDFALRAASSKGYIEIIKILLDNGANINANGGEPIRWARRMDRHGSYLDVIKLLKQHGAKDSGMMAANESIRDLMTPKSEKDVKNSIDKLPDEDKFEYILRYDLLDLYSEGEIKNIIRFVVKNKPKYIFKDLKYEYKILSEIASDSEIREGLSNYALLIAPYMRGYDIHPESRETLAEILYYLYKNSYFYDDYDSTGSLWFKSKKLSSYEGGHFSANAYTTLEDATDYVERMKKLNEGVRDLMTPKDEEDIKRSLENASPQRKLKIGATQNLSWLVKQAIEDGLDMTSVENNNQLIPLCTKGNMEMVKLLVDNGANIDINNGICFQRAVDSKNVELVKFLIDLGADVHLNVDYAIRWSAYYNNTEMVKILLEAGARANVASNFPMNCAIKNNNTEMIELLKKYIKK